MASENSRCRAVGWPRRLRRRKAMPCAAFLRAPCSTYGNFLLSWQWSAVARAKRFRMEPAVRKWLARTLLCTEALKLGHPSQNLAAGLAFDSLSRSTARVQSAGDHARITNLHTVGGNATLRAVPISSLGPCHQLHLACRTRCERMSNTGFQENMALSKSQTCTASPQTRVKFWRSCYPFLMLSEVATPARRAAFCLLRQCQHPEERQELSDLRPESHTKMSWGP